MKKQLFRVKLKRAPKNGVFPDDYYTTTNFETRVALDSKWIKVKHIEMDKGIRVSKNLKSAECVWGNIVRKGNLIIVGEEGQGIKVKKINSETPKNNFGFMLNNISSERSKETTIRTVAEQIKNVKKNRGRTLFVAGPAVIHTGAGKYLARLIEKGFVQILFAGNGLATHDLEENYYGTSLGVNLESGVRTKEGYHKHLRVINLIRKYGSIKKAIGKEIIKGGIMYECIQNNVKFVLCGSIRDDGPLPEVITDTQVAQEEMRKQVRKGIDLAIMIASTLHAIAASNLLPAKTKKVIVDINPAVVTKLSDRGTNAYGTITDAEFFLKTLSGQLIKQE